MRNKDYDSEGFALSVAVHTDTLKSLTRFMEELTGYLKDPESPRFNYATDHANESLHTISQALVGVAGRLENLRRYTNYTAAE